MRGIHLFILGKCPYVGGWVVQKSLKTPLHDIKMAPKHLLVDGWSMYCCDAKLKHRVFGKKGENQGRENEGKFQFRQKSFGPKTDTET